MIMNSYLDLALQGKNEWWRFILAVVLILAFWQGLGALPSIALLARVLTDDNPQTGISSTGQFFGVGPLLGFVVLMLASILFIAGIFLAMRFIHHRPFRSLVTPAPSFAAGRFFQGFFVWLVLLSLMSIVEASIYPGRYVWTFDPHRFVPFVFIALAMIPIQTSAEELFFRAYVLQGFGLRLRNIWILSAISGFLFMLPHLLNPEARVNYGLLGFYYFLIGAVMSYITLRDGRLELALGLHAANNLFTALFANYSVTVLPSPSLFTVNTLDALFSVSAAVIGLLVFVLVFLGPLRQKIPIQNLDSNRVG
jgi:membrane protease YdiL (CAAX protease family)